VSDSADRAPLVSGRVPIPLLIKCGWAFMGLWAGTMYITAGVVLFGAAIDAIANGLAPIRMTRDDILDASGFIVFAAVSGPFAWGVWKERSWTREAVMAFWSCLVLIVVAGMFLQPHSDDARTLLYVLICAGFAVWYFYGKRNVVLYYDELRVRARGA
jgi:CHASE2 domain-containing sensor protein